MSNLRLNEQEVQRWFLDRGDFTHNLIYDLNENSVVMDLGGYTGVWAQNIIEKYNPFIYILEPVSVFYDGMVSKFLNNNKVNLLNVGVGIENKDAVIFMNGDATSSNIKIGESINVKLNTIENILEKFKLKKVDLIQINIEGDEYLLLENMLETGSVNKFKNIQIQFHLGVENDIERRLNIQEGLSKNDFKIKFEYPFVWESWGK
jgi:FkbM family methyltransferase